MTRAALVSALWGSLQRQFVLADIENDDSTGNLKEPVDATLLALGTDYGDLATAEVANGDVGKALTYARYYGYVTIYDAVVSQVTYSKSVGAPSVSKSESLSDRVRNVKDAMDKAKADVDAISGSSWSAGAIYTDTFETGCYAAEVG